MGLLAVLRRYRKAGFLPVLAWVLLQAVMATGVRAAAAAPGLNGEAEAQFLRNLATSICLAGQPDDGQPSLPSLQDRCTWCAAFTHAAMPPPTMGVPLPAEAFVLTADAREPGLPALQRLRYVLFMTRAPPA